VDVLKSAAVPQAPVLDGLSRDPVALFDDLALPK